MRRVTETGEPTVGCEHMGRTRSDPYRDRPHPMSFVRFDDGLVERCGCYLVATTRQSGGSGRP